MHQHLHIDNVTTNSSHSQTPSRFELRFLKAAATCPTQGLPRFVMSPFSYAKVSSKSSQDQSLEQQETHPGPNQTSKWRKTVKMFRALRWPLSCFLLSSILVCEVSILHAQPASLQIGGDINGLVPTCE